MGILVTDREDEDLGRNTVYGADFDWKPTRAIDVEGFASRTDDDRIPGDDWSAGWSAGYRAHDVEAQIEHLIVNEGYQPGIGFLLRRDFEHFAPKVRWRPRVEKHGIRSWFIEGVYDYYGRASVDQLESRRFSYALIGLRTMSDHGFSLNHDLDTERLFAPFEIRPGIVIPAGVYDFSALRLGGRTNEAKRISMRGRISSGDFFDGTRDWLNVTIHMRGTRFFNAETVIDWNDVDLKEGAFVTRILGERLSVTFTPDLRVNAFLQYNDAAELVAANVRFNWIYRPGADLFLVYNETWDAPDVQRHRDPRSAAHHEGHLSPAAMRLRLTTRRGRLAAFFLLYLSEGIPFGFTAVTMTAYLRRHGVGLEAIGLFAASLYAPWGFKWAWAPLVDLVRFERFGASRAWIVFAQSMMIVTIGVVLFFDPATQLGLVTSLIIVHNVFAATQDIAIDALAVRVLPENEMGTANGLMFSAAYIGQAIGGSGALFVAGKLGYDAAFLFMLGALTVLLFAVSLPLLEPADRAAAGARSPGRRAARPQLAIVARRSRASVTSSRDLYDELLPLRPRTADRRPVRDPAAGRGRARARARHHHPGRSGDERGADRRALAPHLARGRGSAAWPAVGCPTASATASRWRSGTR